MPITEVQPTPDDINQTQEVTTEIGEELILVIQDVPFSIPKGITIMFDSLGDLEIVSIPLAGAVAIRPVVDESKNLHYLLLWNSLNSQEPAI